jgi:hypothetical protein
MRRGWIGTLGAAAVFALAVACSQTSVVPEVQSGNSRGVQGLHLPWDPDDLCQTVGGNVPGLIGVTGVTSSSCIVDNGNGMVSVTFSATNTTNAPVTYRLVVYKVPNYNSFWDLQGQTVFGAASVIVPAGGSVTNRTLTTAIPFCAWQADFINGNVITTLDQNVPSLNYTSSNRLVTHLNGNMYDYFCEGCTPGYWKNHDGSGPQANTWGWTGILPSALTNVIFDSMAADVTFPTGYNISASAALALQGGDINAFLRHAVAALLNAYATSSYGLDYDYTVDQVKAMVAAAVLSGNYATAKDVFAAANEQSCPIGNTLPPTN